jgi:hypothetical protein
VDDRKIVQTLKKSPPSDCYLHSLKAVGVKVHPQTVNNRLPAMGYRGHFAKCKPLISVKNRKARLGFAKSHANKPVLFWEKVVWTE